jgi:preprotein translocase SecE subunit
MAKSSTKVRRVKAKDDAKNEPKTISKTENSEVSKPKISKYRAKVEGVNLKKAKKAKKMPKWLRIILTPFRILGKILAFILKPLAKVFAPLGKYFASSWQELKLVRWPTRKETWKMTAGVLIFSISFAIFVTLIDGLFNWIFTTLIGK